MGSSSPCSTGVIHARTEHRSVCPSDPRLPLPCRLRQPGRPGDPRSQRRLPELQGGRVCGHRRRLRHLHPHHHLPRRAPDQDPQAAPEAHAAASRSLVPQHLGQPQMQRERGLGAQRHHHPLTDYREQLLPALREGERGLRAPRLHRAGDAPAEPSQHLLQGVRSSLGTADAAARERRARGWRRREEVKRPTPGTARAAPGAAPGSGGLDAHVLILPFVFSFVVLSFCNPETLRVSLQLPPLLLQTVAGRGGRAPCLSMLGTPLANPEAPPPLCGLGFSRVTPLALREVPTSTAGSRSLERRRGLGPRSSKHTGG